MTKRIVSKQELVEESRQKLRELIKKAGSQVLFGHQIGVTPSTVQNWLKRGVSRQGATLIANSLKAEGLDADTLAPQHIHKK